jgi:hypothetical protein
MGLSVMGYVIQSKVLTILRLVRSGAITIKDADIYIKSLYNVGTKLLAVQVEQIVKKFAEYGITPTKYVTLSDDIGVYEVVLDILIYLVYPYDNSYHDYTSVFNAISFITNVYVDLDKVSYVHLLDESWVTSRKKVNTLSNGLYCMLNGQGELV